LGDDPPQRSAISDCQLLADSAGSPQSAPQLARGPIAPFDPLIGTVEAAHFADYGETLLLGKLMRGNVVVQRLGIGLLMGGLVVATIGLADNLFFGGDRLASFAMPGAVMLVGAALRWLSRSERPEHD
jgi:hypothetical protein